MSDQLSTLVSSKNEVPPPALSSFFRKRGDDEPTDYANTGRATRIGLWALGVGFGGFLLWAAFAPLDEGVPAPAMVSIDTKRKPVQHPVGGIVREILVKEGAVVNVGQVLFRLDDATTRATYESSRQRYLSLRAMEGRLLAEQLGKPAISFHADLLAVEKADPVIAQHMQNQQLLFSTRRAALAAELQGIEENIQGQEAMIRAYAGMIEGRKNQLRLLTEELANTRELVKEGYAPRNRQLELERMVSDVNFALTELTGSNMRAMRGVAGMRQRAIQRRQEFRRETDSNLADVSREAQSEGVRLAAATAELERTAIRAPAGGQVVGLAVQSPGSVIGPGFKLMDIVPPDEELLLEAQVPSHMIDRIQAGMNVDIRFSGFSHSPQLVVQGKVLSISKDLLTVPQTNLSYYLARVGVTPDGMKQLGKRQLQPGMNAEVIFVTGERSLLTYLLGPLTKRVAASLKEE